MTVKLEALEQKIRGTVADARSAVVDTVATVRQSVDSTVQAVRGTVHDTVDSVRHALDLGRHVDRHPWAMLGGSLAAGYVLGRLLPPRPPAGRPLLRHSMAAFPPPREAGRRLWDLHHAGTDSPPAPVPVPAPKVPEAGSFRELTKKFAPEIQQLKGLAIGTLMALARDTIKRSMATPLAPELEQLLDRVTTKLGGVPLSGPRLPAERVCATSNGSS